MAANGQAAVRHYRPVAPLLPAHPVPPTHPVAQVPPEHLLLPGVQLLLPARDKAIVLALHGLSAMALLAATAHPALARLAGSALLLAHAAGFAALCGVDWRRIRFIRGLKEQR